MAKCKYCPREFEADHHRASVCLSCRTDRKRENREKSLERRIEKLRGAGLINSTEIAKTYDINPNAFISATKRDSRFPAVQTTVRAKRYYKKKEVDAFFAGHDPHDWMHDSMLARDNHASENTPLQQMALDFISGKYDPIERKQQHGQRLQQARISRPKTHTISLTGTW